jgi:hypothetical protein
MEHTLKKENAYLALNHAKNATMLPFVLHA